MTWLMVSLSDKISAKFLVPKTFLSVVAANSRVEWLGEKCSFLYRFKKGKIISQTLKKSKSKNTSSSCIMHFSNLGSSLRASFGPNLRVFQVLSHSSFP